MPCNHLSNGSTFFIVDSPKIGQFTENRSIHRKSVNSPKIGRFTEKIQIANGRSMDLEGEWPWMSVLVKEGTEDYFDPEVECVGVLINCNAVLTTASCAQNSKAIVLP